jgi:hypothetical protein
LVYILYEANLHSWEKTQFCPTQTTQGCRSKLLLKIEGIFRTHKKVYGRAAEV